jgi:hypothetical protein
MAKHNKKRNTAFIYETLIREIVKQSVEKNKEKRNTTIAILKEFFKKGSELRKELDLYKVLSKTNNLSEKLAEKLISETIKQHSRINQNKIFKEQSNVIKVINKKISKKVFSNFVPNYKDLATIAQIFSNNLNPKAKVMLENKLVEKMIEPLKEKGGTEYVSNLVIKSFIKRFNDTYGTLYKEQKEILSKYATSFIDNGTEFKFCLNEEIARLKTIVNKSFSLQEVKEDKQLKEKLQSIKKLLENFYKFPVDKERFLHILKIQNLARELTE